MAADRTLAKLIAPLSITPHGLVAQIEPPPLANLFHKSLSVQIESLVPGEIRYTLDGTDPTPKANLYQGPIDLTRSATVKARAFDAAGHPLGAIDSAEYAAISPALRYRYFRAPADGCGVSRLRRLAARRDGIARHLPQLWPRQELCRHDGGTNQRAHQRRIRIRCPAGHGPRAPTIGETQVFDFDQPGSKKPWWETTTFTARLRPANSRCAGIPGRGAQRLRRAKVEIAGPGATNQTRRCRSRPTEAAPFAAAGGNFALLKSRARTFTEN